MVKQLNITFDDEVFRKVKMAKEISDSTSWREWILLLIKKSEEENGER